MRLAFFVSRANTSGKFAWGTGERDRHGRLLFADNDPDEVYIYCATSQKDSNRGHIYATADIVAKGDDPVLGAEQRR